MKFPKDNPSKEREMRILLDYSEKDNQMLHHPDFRAQGLYNTISYS